MNGDTIDYHLAQIHTKMKRIYLLLSLLTGCLYMQAAIYNVRNFGAKADGKAIDSPAINRAIEAAAQEGGGTVYLPAGEYACYSIRLKSNIHLYLEQGARIIAAFPEKDKGYDMAEPNEHNKYQDFGHSHWKNSLIWGIGLENITISGPGLIYGKGLTREESRLPGVGNKAISLKDCRNVTLKDFSMLHCGHFALLATGVEHLTLLNLKVDTNRDGFDIDCCRNVRISQCTVNSPWDDAIVLKASYALGRFKDTENVTISDCYVSGFDKGSVLDGSWQLDEPQAPDHGYRTGKQRRFPQHRPHQLYLRTLSGTGARNRRRRSSGRHRYQQYHHEGYCQRSYLPSPGCAHAQSGRDTHRHHEAYSDQRHQCMER